MIISGTVGYSSIPESNRPFTDKQLKELANNLYVDALRIFDYLNEEVDWRLEFGDKLLLSDVMCYQEHINKSN